MSISHKISCSDCVAMDRADPLAHARERFLLPDETIYLDGNSLGALPASAPRRIADVVAREWGQDLTRSWNTNGWIDLQTVALETLISIRRAGADIVLTYWAADVAGWLA